MIVKEKDTTGNFQTKAYQFITNHRGDVLSIRNQDDQEVGSYSYDAYGNVLYVEGDVAKDNSIRYAGYYYDEETKNYYLQARYYNPENGAFLALDPHPGDDDEPLSQNGYNYAQNNPNKYIDSNGNMPWWILWKGIQGAWVATYPYLLNKQDKYGYKKMWKHVNKRKVSILATTGALTGIMGHGLGLALTRGSVRLV